MMQTGYGGLAKPGMWGLSYAYIYLNNQELKMDLVIGAVNTLGSFDVAMFDPQVLDPVWVIPVIIILTREL